MASREDSAQETQGLLGPEGPYASPEAAAREELSWRRFMWTGLTVVMVASAVGAVVGVGCGLALATVSPEYYGAVFGNQYEPWQLAIGLGFTQGGGTGIGIGLAIVFATAWFRSRTARNFRSE